MAPKSKELSPSRVRHEKGIVNLSTQGFSGKKIDELPDIKPCVTVGVVPLKMFLEVDRSKDAHAWIPGPYCVLFEATADQL